MGKITVQKLADSNDATLLNYANFVHYPNYYEIIFHFFCNIAKKYVKQS